MVSYLFQQSDEIDLIDRVQVLNKKLSRKISIGNDLPVGNPADDDVEQSLIMLMTIVENSQVSSRDKVSTIIGVLGEELRRQMVPKVVTIDGSTELSQSHETPSSSSQIGLNLVVTRQWECLVCTYINNSLVNCDICGATRSNSILTTPTKTQLLSSSSSSRKRPHVVMQPVIIDLIDSDTDQEKHLEFEIVSSPKSSPKRLCNSMKRIWRCSVALQRMLSEVQSIVPSSSNIIGMTKNVDVGLLERCWNFIHKVCADRDSAVLGDAVITSMNHKDIALHSFFVTGKRFGDPQRKGKNRFCGECSI
jgi:hypothetical protein